MFSCNSFTLGRGRSGNMACTLDFPPGAVRGGHGQGQEEDGAPRWELQQELRAVH